MSHARTFRGWRQPRPGRCSRRVPHDHATVRHEAQGGLVKATGLTRKRVEAGGDDVLNTKAVPTICQNPVSSTRANTLKFVGVLDRGDSPRVVGEPPPRAMDVSVEDDRGVVRRRKLRTRGLHTIVLGLIVALEFSCGKFTMALRAAMTASAAALPSEMRWLRRTWEATGSSGPHRVGGRPTRTTSSC